MHGNWAVSDRYPAELLMIDAPQEGKMSAYKQQDFDDVLERIVTLRNECLSFGERVRASILDGGIQPRPEGPTVE